MFNRLFLEGVFKNEKDPQRLKEILTPASTLLKQAQTAAPDNPGLLWVVGPNQWSTPPERGGGQEKAIATYEKGLEAIRQPKEGANDPLEPTWGEPELLMSLAWSNLNRTTPDLKAAEQYVQAALKLVPYWHYVRDTLIYPNAANSHRASQNPLIFGGVISGSAVSRVKIAGLGRGRFVRQQ